MKVTNWGLFPTVDADIRSFQSPEDVRALAKPWESFIARGLGRSYGDSSLATHILSTLAHNRFLAFDTEQGILSCQAGVSFAEILDLIVPKGWFLPVTPGTKFVTVGGAIGSDIHGKNHHSEGSFSKHLLEFRLMVASGEILNCSRSENADVFWATCGGMGLTGIILDATFRLKPIETAYIKEDSIKVRSLDEAIAVFDRSLHYTYSVSWVDCLAKGSSLGKGIVLNGEHAKVADLKKEKQKRAPLELPKKGKLAVPFSMPNFLMNKLTIKTFNILFYAKAPRGEHSHIIDYDTYFYPLDGIHHWNRVYGKRGFVQYQFVMPPTPNQEALRKIMSEVARYGLPSFLTVLKWFGEQEGMLSFPMKGYTVAMDFPITPTLFEKLKTLDKIVVDNGGRIYLTKDARMSAETFQDTYPRFEEWLAIKRKLDPDGLFESLQSKRLGI